VLGGVTLNLYSPTTSPITINIENDTESALDSLTTFIVEYNEMLEKLNPPLLDNDQESYLDPLTDDKMDEMTLYEYEEYQAYYELYNEYQFIRKDSSLRLLYQSLRNTTTSEVQGLGNVLNDLAEIGIYPGSIGGFDDSKEGYLLLAPTGEDDYEETIRDYLSSDTDLMEALTNNADKVYDLFAVEGTSDTGEDTGIARQLDSLLGSYIDSEGILDEKVTSGGSLEEEISRLSDRIETEEERLERLEERLWAQFTAMEEQISKLNAQASSVTALLESSGVNSSLV
jgi:flagellar hook-associated protein 2